MQRYNAILLHNCFVRRRPGPIAIPDTLFKKKNLVFSPREPLLPRAKEIKNK